MFSSLLLLTLLQFCNTATILIPVKTGPQTCLQPTDVFTLEQGCVDRFSNSVCQGAWERLYENEQTGVASCDCDEDFVRVDGRCHQVGTQGPCALNQYLVVQEGVPICNENPCKEPSQVQLPRNVESDHCLDYDNQLYEDYDDCVENRKNYACWTVTGFITIDEEGFQNCRIQVSDSETLELGCIKAKDVSSTIFISGLNRCKRGRVWNQRIGRCVRRFSG